MVKLVLLPGMDGLGVAHEGFAAALGSAVDVVPVRYPPDRPLDYPALEAMAAHSLPAEDDYLILGESFSGPIAIRLAARRPPRLRGLILCGSFVSDPSPVPAWLRTRTLPPRWVISAALAGVFGRRAVRQALLDTLDRVAPQVLRGRMDAVAGEDASAPMRAVAVPVLYLQATRDRVVPPRCGARIAALNPLVEIARVDAPHLLLQSAPLEAARLVAAFIEKLPAGRDAGAPERV